MGDRCTRGILVRRTVGDNGSHGNRVKIERGPRWASSVKVGHAVPEETDFVPYGIDIKFMAVTDGI